MKPKLRLAISPLLVASLLVTPAKPAVAFQDDGSFDDILGIFRQAFDDAKAYVDDMLSDQMDALPGDLGGVIQNALGDLGLIDPNRVRSDILAEGSNRGDLIQTDGIQAGIETANEMDRQLTRAQVDAVLSEAGQSATQGKITWIEGTIGQVQQHADAAQSAVSTQDAIKQMAQQQAQSAEVLGALQSELLQSRQDNQLANLNLSNISQSLDQETRARRMREMGSAVDALQISAQAGLF